MTARPPKPLAVLFDLDGTLADTAPDLGAAANWLRAQHGLPPLPMEVYRPVASHGARGLLGVAFGTTTEHQDFEELRDAFLAQYETALAVDSRLFDGMDAVLAQLETLGIPWGIVTNKAMRFTRPLVHALDLAERCAVVVSGDTTPHSKPHPEPLLHACRALGLDPAACIYVGDDARDIQAGHAAGMRTVVARYGYCGKDIPPEEWGCDIIIDHPGQLLPSIGLANGNP
jgi:2-phosphoglycolate phosphatase